MIRSWVIAVVLVLGACGGKEKLDRAKVDAIVHKADACKDWDCADAAYGEVAHILVEGGKGKGLAQEDIDYLFAAQKVIDAKREMLKPGGAAH
jgi:hypothetical protein